ncbi:MAG: putative Ig domain-containing protein [Ignavibacteriota bacterium]
MGNGDLHGAGHGWQLGESDEAVVNCGDGGAQRQHVVAAGWRGRRSQTLAATGGTGGYTWSVSAGALPVGLTLSAVGAIAGMPSAAGTATFTVQVTDSSSAKATKQLSIAVTAGLSVSTSSLPGGVVGVAYSQSLAATGGTGGYTWGVSAGALPAGLTLSAAGAIAGTPSTAATATFTVQVTDSSSAKATAQLSIAVTAGLSVATSSLPGGVVGAAYSQTLAATGGTGGYTWSVSAGALPVGLTLSAVGAIAGMPSAAGTATFTVQVTDSSSAKATKQLSIAVTAGLSVSTSSLPGGVVGVAYSQSLAATGGTGGYTWGVSAGALPAGLTLSATGAIAGTPSTAATATFTVQVTDSSSAKATAQLSIAVTAGLSVTTSALPGGVVGAAYSQTLTSAGGTGGYTWAVTAGALPAGLTLSTAGAIAGTPSAASTATFTVQVTDSSSAKATAQLSIAVTAGLSVATSSLPGGVVGVAYQQTLAAAGGTGGNTWTVTAGALPAGLTLSTAGAIAGTPSTAATATFTVQVMDSSSAKATAQLSIAVTAGLSVTTSSLPGGVVGVAYSQSLAATGGTGGYTWGVSAGALPAGLTLSAAGVIGGAPSTASTATFTVQVTDSSSAKATAQLSIAVTAGLSVTTSALPGGVVGVAYSQSLAAAGGTGGYTWAVTAGALPAGLTLSTAGAIAGTPSAASTATFTEQVTDSSSAKATAQLSIAVTAGLSVTTSSLPPGVAGVAYQQTLTAAGGTGGYTWTITAGALPAGLTLATAGTISGTPSTSGTANFTVQVADSSSAKKTAQLSIVVGSGLTIGTSSLPTGIVGVAYQQTLAAAGGTGGYTWTITAGAPPAGLTLNASGTIGGTPTTAGTANFTVQVVDGSSAKATAQLSIAVTAGLSVSTSSLPGGVVGVAYSQSLAAAGGTGGYTWTLTAGAPPAGLTLNASGTIGGTPTTAGTANFTVQVVDGSSAKATANFSIAISPALTVVTATGIQTGSVGAAYTQTFTAQGGAPPYTWQISGALPTGLSLAVASGVMSGTPTQSRDLPARRQRDRWQRQAGQRELFAGDRHRPDHRHSARSADRDRRRALQRHAASCRRGVAVSMGGDCRLAACGAELRRYRHGERHPHLVRNLSLHGGSDRRAVEPLQQAVDTRRRGR